MIKIGDKVYLCDSAGRTYESEITKISGAPDCFIIFETDSGECFDYRAIGYSIFASEEEAKKAFNQQNE